MGLDQNVMRTSVKPAAPVDFGEPEESGEVQYWRKHANMHGWMETLYRLKGGAAESFNCVPVELTLADIEALEHFVKERQLPHTTGFFFGQSDTSDRQVEQDLEFCRTARKVLEQGDFLYYTSWW